MVNDIEENFANQLDEFMKLVGCTPCRLMVKQDIKIVATDFIVNTGATTIHGMDLGEDHVHVSIKKVFNNHAVLSIPIPSTDTFLVINAIDTLVP
ncbi:hypothetical protein TorRG33x02_216460 [Trema orientale]|uniref:DUF8039 domain-containing protein n=1 Tax=Trema orientale TaxID=63057 RepID=A0A2P5EAK2_TREOI|nr:hypothetical protein TorRG33x02_216460 [Trema orientale]